MGHQEAKGQEIPRGQALGAQEVPRAQEVSRSVAKARARARASLARQRAASLILMRSSKANPVQMAKTPSPAVGLSRARVWVARRSGNGVQSFRMRRRQQSELRESLSHY